MTNQSDFRVHNIPIQPTYGRGVNIMQTEGPKTDKEGGSKPKPYTDYAPGSEKTYPDLEEQKL